MDAEQLRLLEKLLQKQNKKYQYVGMDIKFAINAITITLGLERCARRPRAGAPLAPWNGRTAFPIAAWATPYRPVSPQRCAGVGFSVTWR